MRLRQVTFCIATLAFFWSLPIAAQTSCLPETLSGQFLETVDLGGASERVHSLKSVNMTGSFVTKVQMVAGYQGGAEPTLALRFRFDPAFDGVSLAYNLYAVLVLADGQPAAWMDFTSGCTGLGIGFFPGREVAVPVVKLRATPAARVQIMVWGKL
ncbi:MAG TPA: hypothetical protein PKC28_13465 [Bdellovibrionales bacterium]|nr:hypothetical protein [Bdellovibrionales bacterium]